MRRRGQRGVTYLAVLMLVAISAVVVVGQGAFSAVDGQRGREDELIFVGGQFRQAIARYYEGTPGPVKRYPESLDELLLDRRFEPAARHLRRIYADPITSSLHWGVVYAPEGGVMGVYSLSTARPMRQSGFAQGEIGFAGKAKYSEWVFLYQGGQTRYVPPRMLEYVAPAASLP
jgi:type II secretory pathway pseudopilin PulG